MSDAPETINLYPLEGTWKYGGYTIAQSDGSHQVEYVRADRIQKLEAELAYYKGVHDGIYSTGTHVVVPVEPTEAMLTRARISNGETRYAFDIKPIYRAMIRAAQEKADE